MSGRVRTVLLLLGLVVGASLLASSSATGAPSASWKQAVFVFTGSGHSDYTYPPSRVGKKQSFTMKWEITWVLKPNAGHAKTVSEKISGDSEYKGNSGPSCSGDVKKANILAPLDPTGSKGKKTLLGAAVPMFNYLATVPQCKGTPGEPAVAAYYGPPAYAKHKLSVAEVAFDAVNPKPETLSYKQVWKGKGPAGDVSSVSWSGTLEVTVKR